MLKKLISIVVIMIFVVSLIGCSEKEDQVEAIKTTDSKENSTDTTESETNTQEESDEKIVLRFATWGVSEESTSGIYKEIEDSYEALNPNVDIEYIGIPFGDIKQQTFVMAATGEAPDIIQTHTAWFSTYATSDVAIALDDLLGADYVNDLIPSLKSDYTYNGELKGVPWAPTPYVLYWNKELFEQAGLNPEQGPKTYKEMVEFGQAISELKTSNGDKIYGLGEVTDMVPINGMVALRNIYGFGGSLFDTDGKVNINTPEVVAMYDYYKQLAVEELTPTSAKLKDMRNLFSIGRLGMYMDESGARNVFRNLSGEGEAFDAKWGVSLVPYNAEDKSVSIGAAHGLVISKDCVNKDVAADFLKFVTGEDMMVAYHDAGDVLSGRQSLSVLDTMVDDDFSRVCVEQLTKYSHSLPANVEGMEQAFLEIAKSLQNITLTDATSEEVVAGLQETLEDIFKEQ